MTYACNPSTWEVEAGEFRIWGCRAKSCSHKEIVSATNRCHCLSSQLEDRGCSFLFTTASQSIKMCIVDAQHYLTRWTSAASASLCGPAFVRSRYPVHVPTFCSERNTTKDLTRKGNTLLNRGKFSADSWSCRSYRWERHKEKEATPRFGRAGRHPQTEGTKSRSGWQSWWNLTPFKTWMVGTNAQEIVGKGGW